MIHAGAWGGHLIRTTVMITTRRFKYHTAAETSEPGYLKRRLRRIRREQAEEAKRRIEAEAEAAKKVRKLVQP